MLQVDDALGVIDGAGDVAPDPPIPHRIVGGLARAPGQDQALGGDAGVGQLPGALADADGLVAAVGVVDRGGPAEQDGGIHIRQRPQGQHDRAGGQIDHTRPIGSVGPEQLALAVVLQVIPFPLRHERHRQGARRRGRHQGDGVGIAPVVGLDLDLGRVGDARRSGRRPETDALAGAAVVRALGIELQLATAIVDGADDRSRHHQLAALVGDGGGADDDGQAARLGAAAEEQAPARGYAGHGREADQTLAGIHQAGQLTGRRQIHRRGFAPGRWHQLGEDGLGLHLHGPKGRIFRELGGGEVVGGIGHHCLAQGGLGVGHHVIGGRLLPLEGVAQRIRQLAGHHVAGELGHPWDLELGQLIGHFQHPHILLELPRIALVADQHQGLPYLRQAHLDPLEEADRPLPFQLGVVQKAAPLGPTGQVALQHVTGSVPGVVVVFGGHQAQAHVGVARRQQHGGVGTVIGVGVVGLHRQKRLAQVDHPIGAVEIADIGKQAVVLAADDFVAGDSAAAIGGIRQPLAGQQLDVAGKNAHGVTSRRRRVIS